MSEKEKRGAAARWINYVIRTRPQYEVEMAESAIGIKGSVLRSIAQDIVKNGVLCGAKVVE
ncbi:MAG: hypothetical protein U0M51_04310 [Eggerthellaceae bacterium]